MKTQLNTNYTCKLVASPRWQEQQRQQGAAARTANKTNKQKKSDEAVQHLRRKKRAQCLSLSKGNASITPSLPLCKILLQFCKAAGALDLPRKEAGKFLLARLRLRDLGRTLVGLDWIGLDSHICCCCWFAAAAANCSSKRRPPQSLLARGLEF